MRDVPSNSSPGVPERIWTVVAAIPVGRVATYGQVAELAGLPRGARAVGLAMARLPAGTRLPWHRVINATGKVSIPGAEVLVSKRCSKPRAWRSWTDA